MSSVFSDYVRSLGAGGEPPDPSTFDRLLAKLRGALVYELKKRSLWSSPPSYLGVYGGAQWTEGDLLEELLLDCYLFIFIRRLPGLTRQLAVRSNIDGLIFLNIRHFLYEAQRRHDPLGFRIFEVLQAAVLSLLEAGVLRVLAGDAKVRNDTVLGFTAWGDPQAASGLDLRPQAEAWNSQLLPELITARSKDDVRRRLESLIATLPGEGVEVFGFGDLIEPMKDDARARWQAIRLRSEVEGAGGEGGGEPAQAAGWARPDRGFEERESFEKLIDCVDRGLEQLEARARTQEYLRRLWLFLRSWTSEPGDRSSAKSETAAERDRGERFPSDLQLSRELQIPRGRIPGLKATLGRLVDDCRDRISGKPENEGGPGAVYDTGAAVGQTSQAGSGGSVMESKDRREQLRLQTGEAAARYARQSARTARLEDRPPQPGDTFLFAEASALPVEWALLEPDAADPRRVLVAPVDDRPFAGSRDVATAGVEVVRCGLATWLDLEALEVERRAGALEDEDLERARRRGAEIAGGTLRATASEGEVDGSPEYLGWMRMLAEARTALPGDPRPASPEVLWAVRPSTVARFRRPKDRRPDAGASPAWKSPSVAYALAAAFAAAALGLSLLVGQLRRELSRPLVLPASTGPEIVFLDPDRLPETLTLTATASHVSVFLILSRVDDAAVYRVEVLEQRNDEVLWTSGEMTGDTQFLLALPRRLLTAAEYRLRLYSRDESGEDKFLEEREVRVQVE